MNMVGSFMNRLSFLFIFLAGFVLTGCEGENRRTSIYKSVDKHEERYKREGSLISDRGGFSVMGTETLENDSTMGINRYLWRASLAVLSGLSVESADPFSGVIQTSWSASGKNKGSQLQVSAYILGPQLKSDLLKVVAHRQVLVAGKWVKKQASAEVSAKIKTEILMKARALKLADRS